MEELSICRFCLHEEGENNKDQLITPCKCKGSMRYVHASCLSRWRSTNNASLDKCTLCNCRYVYAPYTLAVYSYVLNIMIFIVFLYMIDLNSLLFSNTIEEDVWVTCMITFLQVCFTFIILYDSYTGGGLCQYVNVNRLGAISIIQMIIGWYIQPIHKIGRIGGLATFYELSGLLLVWLIGNPAVIIIDQDLVDH